MKTIHLKFAKRLQPSDQVATTSYHYRKETPYLDLFLQHISVNDFRTYMFFSEQQDKPEALQKYVLSKTSRNSVIKCHWSPVLSVLEKQTNAQSLFDLKYQLDDRVVTFEGSENKVKNENVVSTSLIDEINTAISQIQEHLKTNSDITLLGGIFYFKIDKSDNLVLLFVTNIKTDKVDYHINDNMEIRLKLWNQIQHSDLPTVIVTKRTQGSRPVSHYQNRLGQKFQECPFCDQSVKLTDGFETTINQILKIYNYYQDNVDLLQDISDKSENYNFNKNLYLSIQRSRGVIPEPILKLNPSMTYDKYLQKKNDPIFLYDSLKMCETCYSQIKNIIEQISLNDDSRDQISQQNIRSQKQTQRPRRQSERKLQKPNIYSFQNDDQLPTLLKTKDIQSEQNDDLQSLLSKSKTFSIQKKNIPETKTVSDTESNRFMLMDSEQEYDIQSEKPTIKPVMMFAKVEAGIEIENNIFNAPPLLHSSYKKQYQQQQRETIELRMKKRNVQKPTQKQFNFVKVQNPLKVKVKEHVVKQQQALPKIDWEKEYKQSVKEKANQAKNEIFYALEQIENGQLPQSEFSNEQTQDVTACDIQLDDSKLAHMNKTKKHLKMFAKDILRYNSQNEEDAMIVKTAQRRTRTNNIIGQFQNESSLKNDKNNYIVTQKSQRNIGQQDHSKGKLRDNHQMRQQREEIYMQDENQYTGNSFSQSTNNLVGRGRLRPLSSKPAPRKNLINIKQSQNIMPFERKTSMQQKKKKQQEIVPVSSSNNGGGGLFNFQAMTDNDIQNIANNADQLISIIQNIKGTLVQPPPMHKVNIADIPCYEEDQEDEQTIEDDLTQEEEEGKHVKQKDGWW